MKTLKDFLKFKSGKVLDIKYPIELFDKSGNKIYHEDADRYWGKHEFNKAGNRIYYEDSTGYWYKQVFDKSGNQTYYKDSNGYWHEQVFDKFGNKTYFENSNGHVIDKRSVAEMSVAEIEKALGHKVKVIK